MVELCKCGCGEEVKEQPHHKYYGVPEFIKGHWSRTRRHSDETKAQISASLMIKDRTQLTQKGYPLSYYDVTPLVRDRDGHICQLCGEPEKSKQHNVHHIDKNKLNSDPFNLVSLCDSCHRRVHVGVNND